MVVFRLSLSLIDLLQRENPVQVLGALNQNLAVRKLRGELLCYFETFSSLFIMT